MYKNRKIALLCVVALCCLITPSFAQDSEIKVLRTGVITSYKEQNVSIIASSSKQENTFNVFNLGMDTYGMFNYKSRLPGGKFSFSHDTIFHRGGFDDGQVEYILYVGAGFVGGYGKDFSNMKYNPGAILGITSSVGTIVAFKGSKLELGLDFTAQWAIHIRKMEEKNGLVGLSWYANGLIYALIPQVCIYYRFQ